MSRLVDDLSNKLHIAQPLLADQHGQVTSTLRDAGKLDFLSGIGEVKGVASKSEFRWRDCEPLLEQASALLDRALLDRNNLQLAAEKFISLMLELVRSLAIAMIADDEQDSNRYGLQKEISTAELASHIATEFFWNKQINKNVNGTAADTNSDYMQIAETFLTHREHLIKLQGALAEWSAATPGIAVAKGEIVKDAILDGKPIPTDQTDSVKASAEVGRAISMIEQAIRWHEIKADLHKITGQLNVGKPLKDAAQLQSTWDEKNEIFLLRRAEVETKDLLLRLAILNEGWILDFGEQIENLKPRYQQTLRDAHDRLLQVRDGLIRLYGQDKIEELPILMDESSVDKTVA